MNIQASRLQSALAAQASAAPTRSVAAAIASDATPTPNTSTTVTISQAAKELLAQSQASVSLSSRAMDLIQRRNPFDSAPGSGNPHAQVRQVMDNLTTQYNNKQISNTQYQHDMAFYTRVANALG